MTKYKILTGSDVIYDSSDKYEYPVTEPVLNLELGEAGNLEFTVLPGHPQHGKLLEMQTFISAYQDDEQIFYGRVLQANEDIYHQIKITCEGALTFLLDSEMEPGTYNETMSAFLERCINEHNQQVEEAKRFAVGTVEHEESDSKLEFKLEGYNQTRQVLDNLLTGKHGGFLQVRYENGQRYLDYIQQFSKVNNQPIKTGVNVIDRDKHISGENLFTIVRPLGKNGLTIEGASSVNLMANPSIVNGKYLDQGGGDRVQNNEGMIYSDLIPVTPGSTYLYGPGDTYVSLYDEDEICMKTLDPDGTYSVTIPETIDGFDEKTVAYVRLSYHSLYDKKITFIDAASRTSLIIGNGGKSNYALGFAYTDVQINALGDPDTTVRSGQPAVELSDISRECETETPGWNYKEEYIAVTAGQTYLAIPGAIRANFYTYDNDSQQYICKDAFEPDDDIGCDIFTVPQGMTYMRLSYPNQFGEAMRVFSYTNGDNLIARETGGTEGKIEYHPGEVEIDDAEWCYNSNYIEIEELKYYTGGPSQIRMSFYDEDKNFISSEHANREGLTMHYVRSPEEAKFARVSFLSQYIGEQQLQKGKALILTKLDAGTKTILMPERIAKYGQIVHTEQFADIDDAQELYNAAIEWVSLHQSMLPASVDFGIVDLHLLNPDIDAFELGDVYDNLEGFEDEIVTIGSLTKDMENPANDKITVKNLAELSGSDAGKSSGSLSSKYAASGGGSGGGSGTKYKYYSESEDDSWAKISGVKEITLKALEMLNLEAPRIRILAEEHDGLKARIDIIARGQNGNESRIAMTDSVVAVNTENLIHQAKNIYNIADNVTTIAGTVFTHANLIWNEAKDIVTIAENLYVVADNISVLANKINIIAGDIDILADNIRITMRETDGLRAYLELTASHLRAEFENDWYSMRSYLELTASQLRLGFENGYDSLRSYLEMTASQLRIGFENDRDSLRSYLEMTASQLRLGFENDRDSLRSYLEMTASQLRLGFENDADSLRSYLEMTASQLRLGFDNDVDSLRSYLEMTASQLRVAFDNERESLRSYLDMTASQVRVLTGVLEVDANNNLIIKEGSGLYLRRNNANFGVYDSGTLTAGVIAETLTGKQQGNKTALRLLGDEIDIRGNTFIDGILDVSKYIQSGDFVLKNTVKFGTDGVSLTGAVNSISINQEAGTLTYTTFGNSGGTTLNFNSAASIIGIGVAVSDVTFVPSTNYVIGKCDVSLYKQSQESAVVKVLRDQYISLDASDARAQGRADRSVTSSNTIGLSRSDTGNSVNSNLSVVYADGTSGSIPITINAVLPYLQGFDDGAASVSASSRTATSAGSVSLNSSDTGSSVTKYTTVTYDDNSSTSSIPITINASAVYNAGRNSVGIYSIGRVSSDTYNSSTHNTTIAIEAVASNNARDTESFVVSGASAYNAGYTDGAASVSVSSRTATYVAAGSNLSLDNTGKYLSGACSVYYDDNSYTPGVSLEVNATAAYNAGQNSVQQSGSISINNNNPPSYFSSNKSIAISVIGTLTNGNSVGGTVLVTGGAVNNAYDDGASSVGVSSWSVDKSNMPSVTVTATLTNGKTRTYTFNV